MEQEKKIRKLIVDFEGRRVEFFVDSHKTISLTSGSRKAEFTGQQYMFLYYLLRQRKTGLKRSSLHKELEDVTDKNKRISNILTEINKKLKTLGLHGLIITSTAETELSYRLKAKEIDAEYGYEDEDIFVDDCAPGTASYPPASAFLEGEEIRADYLPLCLVGSEGKYATLDAFIQQKFLRSSDCSSLIVSAMGGGGKTFSLCHVYENARKRNLPVFYVRADSLGEEEHNLLHYIARSFLQSRDYHSHMDVVERFMAESRGPVLILVDGLNECSGQKRTCCTASFRQLLKQYPDRIKGVFSTRFAQTLKSRLSNPLTVKLSPLPLDRFPEESRKLLSRLHVEATPLIRKLLESTEKDMLDHIHSRYDLYTLYFDELAAQADQLNSDGWIYDVLGHVAVRSMEGQIINNRWLKELCSDKGEYDFIHQWCASEEYPLEDASAVEKLKGTGFLKKTDDFDRYAILHQQFRDCLVIRHGMLQLACGVISAAEFADKLLDATRYYRLSDSEDMAAVNLRRHNNMDLGEFGFYALLKWYEAHPEDHELLLKLAQLGIQVSYLFDNLQNWHGLYGLHGRLEDLLAKCSAAGPAGPRMIRSLPGYYFCLNKLVTAGHGIKELSKGSQLLSFSKRIEDYYENWLKAVSSAKDAETEAIAHSGLGGVYLSRSRITSDYEEKVHWLSKSIEQHTLALNLRKRINSPKQYLSQGALGTVHYYKAKAYLEDPSGANTAEAKNLFNQAVNYHRDAVSDSLHCPEKYVYWTRMAGCFFELYQLACLKKDDAAARECQAKLLDAFRESARELEASAHAGGALRLASEIRTLLLDINRSMHILPLYEADGSFIDRLCTLYHDVFPYESFPARNQENTRIIFK